jgi:hypothetical protein
VKSALLVICCVLGVVEAQVPEGTGSRSSRVGAYVLEGLGGLPGVAGCGCLAMGFGTFAYISAWGGGIKGVAAGAVSLEVASLALLPAAAAMGTISVGERLGEHGSRGWAIGGAYAGLVVGAGTIALGLVAINSIHPWDERTRYLEVSSEVLGFLAIPVGAVVGYNVGAKHGASVHGLEGRLQAPSLALTSVRLPDHSVEYGVRVRLAGLEF